MRVHILLLICLLFVSTLAYTPMTTYGQGTVAPPNILPPLIQLLVPPATGPAPNITIPTNTSPAAICSPTTHFVRDYYWALCRINDSTLGCPGLLWYALQYMDGCVQSRNNYVPGAAAYTYGFWSSTCQCHYALQRLVNALVNTGQNPIATTCSGSLALDTYQTVIDMRLGKEDYLITNMFSMANNALTRDATIDATTIAQIEAQGPPLQAQYLDVSHYRCNITHNTQVPITSPYDSNPAADPNYTWTLFWTIPPAVPQVSVASQVYIYTNVLLIFVVVFKILH